MLTNSHQIKILSATTNINRSKSWCTKGNTAIEPHLECRHKAEHAVAAPTSEEAVIVVAVDVWSIAPTRWKAAIHFSLCNVNANELKGRVEVKRSK
jgi:hypothetical protein